MSLPAALSNDTVLTAERRRRLREAPPGVVLVFFEDANWGKLIEIHEDGMSFEFDHLPPVRQRINFAFRAMGCMPMPPDGEEFAASFQAAGEVLWTRGFERVAGVRFVDLDEPGREQIREWLAFGKTGTEAAPIQEVEQEVLDLAPEPSEPLTCCSKTPTVAEVVEEALASWKATASVNEPSCEPSQPVALQDRPAASRTKSPTPPAAKPIAPQWKSLERASILRRGAFVGIASGVVAIAVFGARPILTHLRRGAEAAPSASVPSVAERANAGKSFRGGTSQPFQVEVLEASGKKWMLGFVRDASLRSAVPAVAKSPASAHSSFGAPKTASPREASSAEKPEPAREFALAAPKISPPTSTAAIPPSPVAEPPVLSEGITATPMEPTVSLRPEPASPAPGAKTPRMGGDVQQARLLKSVSPDYPPMAKKAGIAGDVVMDAVIDSAGNVTAVKVISGPPLLRDAAVDALRQWKYEAARLDGSPVAMNLRVALRFRVK